MAKIYAAQAGVPYTPEEKARIDELNAREEAAIFEHYNVEPFNLTRIQRGISAERTEIDRAARRRAMAQSEVANTPAADRESASTLPEPPSNLQAQQFTLGDDFATNRNLAFTVASPDLGEMPGPLTAPPKKPDPNQFSLPEGLDRANSGRDAVLSGTPLPELWRRNKFASIEDAERHRSKVLRYLDEQDPGKDQEDPERLMAIRAALTTREFAEADRWNKHYYRRWKQRNWDSEDQLDGVFVQDMVAELAAGPYYNYQVAVENMRRANRDLEELDVRAANLVPGSLEEKQFKKAYAKAEKRHREANRRFGDAVGLMGAFSLTVPRGLKVDERFHDVAQELLEAGWGKGESQSRESNRVSSQPESHHQGQVVPGGDPATGHDPVSDLAPPEPGTLESQPSPPSALPANKPGPLAGSDLLVLAPMTEEESLQAGSGLETDATTGRLLTPTERWLADATRPPPQSEEPGPAPATDAAPTVTPTASTAREPDETDYQRAWLDRDCPLPDGDACVAILKPGDLQTDARLFQYKGDTDDQGVSVKLADVKTWDSDLAGVAYVWERADGERFIVDGHQRLALANRLQEEGQEPELLVKIWREADGYTPRMMRLSAAKKNIAEGSGTAVDAARVLREEPGLFDTLSQLNAIVRDAKGLARLDQDVFNETLEHVNAGQLPENVASLIADAGPDPALQRGTLQEFVREQRRGHMTRAAAQNLLYVIRRNRLDEVESKAQGALTGFDVGAVRGSAWRERAALQQGLVNAFRNDRRLFGEVVRGDSRLEAVGNVLAEESNESELTAARANIEIFDRLANKRGPLADYLDAEAARIKGRMDETGASRQGATGPSVRDSARYLRPFLKTYIKDGGSALVADQEAKRGPVAASPTSPIPETAPPVQPEVVEQENSPGPARPHVSAAQVTTGPPAPSTNKTQARQPVTAEAVKRAGAAGAKTASKSRSHVKAPPIEECPAPAKTNKRSQEKPKDSPATPTRRRASRQSDFTPAEIRRFERSVNRTRRRR